MEEREKKIDIILKQHPELDRETAAAILDKHENLMRYAMMSKEERFDIINTGAFNSIITGYAMYLRDYLEFEKFPNESDIERAMAVIFDEITAEQAYKKYNEV